MIFKTNIIALLPYGWETWGMTKENKSKLDVFPHRCLRKQGFAVSTEGGFTGTK